MSEIETMAKKEYTLREVFVNAEHVVCLREDNIYKQLLIENRLVDGLDKDQTFTKIYLDRGHSGIELTVIGSPSSIQEKLGLATKQLLRG